MARKTSVADEVVRVTADAEARKLRSELTALRRKYEAAHAELDALKQANATLTALRGVKSKRISTRRPRGPRAHATAVLILSDWHVEERVDPATCRGLNRFDLEICEQRIEQLVRRSCMLIEHETALTDIDRICVAPLGDFISGAIHDDLVEINQLAPLAAMRWAASRLCGVVDAMAKIAPVLVATACGNHGRTTLKPRVATEHEHSFEQNAYLTMAAAETRQNVEWQIGTGYLNVVDLFGFKLRLHHGHGLKYSGGVGGLTIPALKAIAAWNTAERVDLDAFGHWHQHLYIPNRFVANASLIGHNAFADRIKAEWQPPSQTLVIIDREHRRVTKALQVFLE